jgi:hypothetical protein
MASMDRKKPFSESSRRPYEPPAIEETGNFERLVLSCGHTPEDFANGMEECGGPQTGMGLGSNS